MERMEQDFGCPVVASNPAMLWFILSQLGHTHHIEGHGRLLREWPTAPA
jgi:maleate cis-trans isomerase